MDGDCWNGLLYDLGFVQPRYWDNQSTNKQFPLPLPQLALRNGKNSEVVEAICKINYNIHPSLFLNVEWGTWQTKSKNHSTQNTHSRQPNKYKKCSHHMVLSIRLNGKVSSGVGNKLKLENQTYGDFDRLICDSILIFLPVFANRKVNTSSLLQVVEEQSFLDVTIIVNSCVFGLLQLLDGG